MKLFLTGATGFVGSHVARTAAAQGASLRLLVRKTSKIDHLDGLDADLVAGDLLRPNNLASAIAGCDAVLHVAADYRLWVRDPAAMYAANVGGTAELLRMAREAGVPRFVYTSSVATMGFRSDGAVANEDSPVELAAMVGHYKRSKFLAEQEAIKAARLGQHVMILNPTTPIGSGDSKPTPTGRIVVDFLNRKFPAYVDTGLNLVDVEQIARVHLAALEVGSPGSATFSAAKILLSNKFSIAWPPSRDCPALQCAYPTASRWPSRSSTRMSLVAFVAASRALRSKQSAWGRKKCLPPLPKLRLNLVFASFLWSRRFAPPSHGFARTAMRLLPEHVAHRHHCRIAPRD